MEAKILTVFVSQNIFACFFSDFNQLLLSAYSILGTVLGVLHVLLS